MQRDALIKMLKKVSHVRFAMDKKFKHDLELQLRSKFENKPISIFKTFQKALLASKDIIYVQKPLVGTIACGKPILAEENIERMVAVPQAMARPPHKYFLLRAEGDSMNEKGINDGDMVLIRQQNTAQPGDTVVALIDDKATIKELQYGEGIIILQPRSSNKSHKQIIVNRDILIQGIVVTTIREP